MRRRESGWLSGRWWGKTKRKPERQKKRPSDPGDEEVAAAAAKGKKTKIGLISRSMLNLLKNLCKEAIPSAHCARMSREAEENRRSNLS